MNGERPGQDPFDVRGGLFAESHDSIEIFEAEMVLLCGGSAPVGLAAVGGFRAIHVIEPQVQFLAGSLDLETVAVVQVSLDQVRRSQWSQARQPKWPLPYSMRETEAENRHFFITVVFLLTG